MRVLHLIKTSFGAGWALRQIRELLRYGVNVHVAIPKGGPKVGCYSAVGATEHLLQTDFPIRSPWTFPNLVEKFRKLVANINPEIIHSHFVGNTLTMRLALGRDHRIPRIFQVPGPLHLEHCLFRKTELWTAGEADYWIGSCKWTCLRYSKSGLPEDRIFLVYYGIDINNSAPENNKGKLRQELGISQETPIIGMVSYIYSPKRYLCQKRGIKGHEDLIDALVKVRQQFPDIKGVFVGGAWTGAEAYTRKVQDYAMKRLGESAIFLNTRNDVLELYPDFDVAVHPSHSENVGGAIESLMMQIPTIATNVGGFPDIIFPGKTGWLVPPKNPEALANVIKEVLLNRKRAKDMAKEGRKIVKALFDVRRNAIDIKSIYRHILLNHSKKSLL